MFTTASLTFFKYYLFLTDCSSPPTVANATSKVSNNETIFYLSNTEITYTCNSGMRILPEELNTITCIDGNWNEDPGKCYSGKLCCFVYC